MINDVDNVINDVEIVEEEISTTTPLVILFVVGAVSMFGAIMLVEHRRKHSNSTWMADQRTLMLYRGMVVISLAQGCLALYKVVLGDISQGLLDGTNAVIGYYATQYALSYLKAYLAVSMFTTMIDVLGLLWNGIICIDIARPALCVAGIYFAREFILEKKDVAGDDLLESNKNSNDGIERLLTFAMSTSVVQQAMIVLGVIDMDPLLFGSAFKRPTDDKKDAEMEHPCKAQDEPARPEPAEISSNILGSNADDAPMTMDLVSEAYKEEVAPCDLLDTGAPTASDLLEPMGMPTTSDLLDVGTVEFASDDQGFVF